MFEYYQLQNKAKVCLIPLKDTRSITGLIMFPVGSRYEPEKLNGVSHFIEHLMFKGTKKRKNTLTLTREIDRLGAEYNAFTGKEYTGYYIKADIDYTDTVLDILADMLYNSIFDPKEMEREKSVIVEELRMYNDNPIMNLDNIFESVMFKGSPMAWDIGGTPKHVMSYRRNEILSYRGRYYDPSNMTIVLAGSINEATKVRIETYFGQEPAKHRVRDHFKPAVFGPVEKDKRIVVQSKKTEQAQIMLGFPGFHHQHINNSIVSVLNTILGGSMSSRLFIQIRERRRNFS